MAPRLILLGWDSATFDVVDPLLAEDRLPGLAGLLERGFRAPLRSTWPPMTDCAWTSAFTGVGAGTHGIFGSWYRAPGAYACRYFSARDRRAPALWELAPGTRFLVWNVPMSFPPAPVSGAMVSGYGAPPGARFCEPADLQDELARRWPLEDLVDRAPHGSLESFLDDLLRGLDAQAEALPWATEAAGADCVVAVWPHVDRAQHFLWRFRGTGHSLARGVERVYEAMDRATQALVEAYPAADVVVASDHGAGPLLGDVNLGAWLARTGRAVHTRPRRARLLDRVWALPPSLRRAGRRLAPGLARRAVGATLSGQLGSFDWARTQAFLGFHGDLWLNLRGREPDGCVAPEDAPRVLDGLSSELLELEDPRSGAPVVAGVHRRAEIFSGPCDRLAPDLMLDAWSAGYRVSPGRAASDEFVVAPSALAGVREPWSADHRPLGMLVAAGPRIAHGRAGELSLLDLCPTALALLEQAVPEGLEGRTAEVALDARFVKAHPVRTTSAPAERTVGGDYAPDEAAAVAAHLKDLGYIE